MPEFIGRRCGTHDVSTGDRERMTELEARFRSVTRIDEADLTATIKIAFIHVVDGAKGVVTAQQRKDQIAVLNEAYKSVGIDFVYEEAKTLVVDNSQFFRMGHQSARERDCKTQNQVLDPQTGLNFYTAAPGGGLLGWATFPFEMDGDPAMDGVVILHTSLPGGNGVPYHLGATAVHEVGHWLGLYHTFQDGCFGQGDDVADTPAHAAPNFGKPTNAGQPHNLCPNAPAGSLCPIHNFMNYVDDDTMDHFTPGQKARIWAQIGMFRSGLIANPQARVEADQAHVVW